MHRSIETWLRHVSRRDVLRLSAVGGVSFLLPALEGRAVERRGSERPTSLITLWMGGGQSQLESWDPHPESKFGGPVKTINTTVPDVLIAEHFPRVAEQMQHLAIIRSMISKEGDHERGTYFVQTGYRPDATVVHPSVSAVLSKYLRNPAVEIPQHFALATGSGIEAPRGGYLGDQYDAFRVYEPGRNLTNLRKSVEDERQQRRLEGLQVLSESFRKQRSRQADATLHQHVQQEALTMMTSTQLKAFELETEPLADRLRYGETRFGRGCLLARRLVEVGVRAIQVTLNGFDTHANNFNGQKAQAEILDPAFAALVEDLVARDLWDSTIVLCISEFGRTPRINPAEGRDHWPLGFSCVLGGGGFRGGQVIGQTDPAAGDVGDNVPLKNRPLPERPVTVPDLYCTILTQLGLDPTEQIITPIGRPIALVDHEGQLIPELLS